MVWDRAAHSLQSSHRVDWHLEILPSLFHTHSSQIRHPHNRTHCYLPLRRHHTVLWCNMIYTPITSHLPRASGFLGTEPIFLVFRHRISSITEPSVLMKQEHCTCLLIWGEMCPSFLAQSFSQYLLIRERNLPASHLCVRKKAISSRQSSARRVYLSLLQIRYLHIKVDIKEENSLMQIWHSDVNYSINKVNCDEDTC